MVQVWPLGHSLTTTALMDNSKTHRQTDRHTHHPVKDNMKITSPHKHIFRKQIFNSEWRHDINHVYTYQKKCQSLLKAGNHDVLVAPK